jgi:glycerol dehydrogenase-like iron-containing ADH family enzyme
VFVIVYTILAFVTALIAEIFFNRCRIPNLINCHDSSRNSQGVVLSDESISQIATRVAEILNEESESSNNCNCNCSSNEVASVNVRNNTTGARSSWCCYRR